MDDEVVSVDSTGQGSSWIVPEVLVAMENVEEPFQMIVSSA